jgi:alkaline phosphatase D
VAERKVPGVVVLGGDVHANCVADLKRDFQDPKSPVLASEFCGTSISSHGPSQARVNQLLALNPHVHHGRGDQRGYVDFALSTQTLQASLMVVEHPNDAMSAVRPDAQFVVDAKQAGPQRT